MTEADWEYDVPSSWPRWARRAFLLTFPISAPLYVASFVVVGVAIIVLALPCMAVCVVAEKVIDLWSNP